jgi:type I restriction enzyme, S subunit
MEGFKKTEIGLVPEDWEVTNFAELVKYTKKPRGLEIKYPVEFIAMDNVPLDKIYIEKSEKRNKITSGTYVEKDDLLLAKITPSFENGKQGILNINSDYAFATTEVIPIKGLPNM